MAASFQRAVLNQENVTCIVYPAKSWSPHQARPDQNRIRRKKNSDPLRQMDCRTPKVGLFPEKFATVRQLSLAGGGGVAARKKSAVLALSACQVMVCQDRRPPLHRINTDHSRLKSPALFGVTYREFPHADLSADRESWDHRQPADGRA